MGMEWMSSPEDMTCLLIAMMEVNAAMLRAATWPMELLMGGVFI